MRHARRTVAEAVIDYLAGPYEWGRNDCLTVAEGIAVEFGHPRWLPAVYAAHGITDERSARRHVRRWGEAIAYGHALDDAGPWRRLDADARPDDGDLVLVDWRFSVRGGEWDGERRPAVGVLLDGVAVVTGRLGFTSAGVPPARPLTVWRLDCPA